MDHAQFSQDFTALQKLAQRLSQDVERCSPEDLAALSEALSGLIGRVEQARDTGWILDSITDGLLAIDRDWTIRYINQTAAQNGYFDPRDLAGKNLWEAFPALVGTPLEAHYRQVMEKRQAAQFEMRGVLRDKWYLINVYPSANGITVFWIDNTAQREAEVERERIQSENRRHKALLDAIFEADPSGLAVVVGPELRFAYANPTYRLISPDPSIDPIGQPYARIWPSQTGEWYQSQIQNVVNTGQPFQWVGFERHLSHGTTLYFTLQARRIDWDGLPAALVILWDNTTLTQVQDHLADLISSQESLLGDNQRQKEQLEKALTEAVTERNRLQAVMESLPVGVAIVDAQGGSLQTNREYDEIWRGPRPTPHSVDEYAAFKAWWADSGKPVQPDEWASAQAVQQGTTVSGQLLEIERFDGSRAFVLNSGAPIFDAEKQITGSAVAILDITQRKQAELALLEREKEMRLIIDAAPALISYIDQHCCYVRVNKAYERWFGQATDQVRGRHIREILGDEAWQVVRPFVEKALAGEEVMFEQELQFLSGESRWVHVTYTPDRDPQGRVQGFVVHGMDIGERKQIEEKIRVQNEVLNGVNRIFREALASRTEEELGRTCLAVTEEVTRSKFGFLGEIGTDGLLHPIAISDPGWENCAMEDKAEYRGLSAGFQIHGLYGRVLKDGKSLLTNSPAGHPDAIGVPAGHPTLTAFLGVPLILAGRIIGMIAVGNRDGGYTQTDLETLEALAPAMIEAFAHKRAETARRESEERFRTTLSSIGDAVITTDPLGRVTFLNPVAEKLTGWSTPEAAGQPLEEIFPIINEDTQSTVQNPVAQVLRDGMVVGMANHTALVARDGKFIPIEDSAAPIRDAIGEITGVVMVFHDVSQKRKAEEELRQSQALLKAVTDNTPDAIYVKDAHSRLLMANPATLRSIGKPAEEVIGKTDREYYADPAIGDAIMENDRRIISSQKTEVIEETAQTPEGYRIFLSTKTPWRDPQGRVAGLVGVARDITERKQMEQELRSLALFPAENPNPILRIAADGTLLYANEIAKYLLPGQQGLPEDLLAAVAEAFTTASVKEYSLQVAQKTYSFILAPIAEQGYVNLYGRDVTELSNLISKNERQSKQLQELNKKLVVTNNHLAQSNQQLGSANQQIAESNQRLRKELDERQLIEQALRDSEIRLNRSQEIAHLGSWELDLVNGRLTWSDEVYRIFGLQPQAFGATYAAFLDAVHPDDRAAVDEAYSGSIRDGRDTYEIEHRVIRKPTGEIRTVHEKCAHFRGGSGQIIRSVGMVHDITERKQAEQILAAEREWSRTTLSSIGDAVITTDPLGRVTFLNPVAEKLTGWSTPEAAGQPLEKIFPIINEDTQQPVQNPVVKVLREGLIVGLANHTALMARDGRLIPIEDSAAPIRGATGEIIGVVMVFHDVTIEREAERNLRESEERYRNLFNTMLDGFALHEIICDAGGAPVDYRFLEINPAFEQLTGLKAADLLGKTVREVLPGIEPSWIKTYGQVALTGKGARFEDYSAPLDKWYEVFAFSPRKNQFATVFTEVTERKRAELALHESEERFVIALKNSPVTVYTTAPDLRYTWIFNPHPAFQSLEILGKTDAEIGDAEDLRELIELKQQALSEKQGLRKEIRLRIAGHLEFHDITVEPSLGLEGEVLRLTVAAVNITELRRLQVEMMEAAKHLEVQHALIAHREQERMQIARDLHDGPLQELLGARLILHGLEDNLDEKAAEMVRTVEKLLQDQVAELRAYAMELRPPALSDYRLETSLRAHIDAFQGKHPDLKVELEAGQEGELLPEAIRVALFRTYQEAMNNIARHARAGGVIIRFNKTNKAAFLEIQDDGAGFTPPEDWLSLARHGHLGLVGMRERVQDLGGALEIVSDPGKGTLLRAVIPLENHGI